MENNRYLNILADNGVDNAHPGGFALTKSLLRTENLTSEMYLLEVGCGTGQTSAYIGKTYPCQVVAVDLNPQMLENARRKFNQLNLKIPLYRANATDLPFRKNSFDIVLSESVTVFTNIRKTLREYYRVLKNGGVLLAIEATAIYPFNEEELKNVQKILGIPYLPTKDEWYQMIKDAGFSNIQLLTLQKMDWRPPSHSQKINNLLRDYINLKIKYRKKLGYGVYRCKA